MPPFAGSSPSSSSLPLQLSSFLPSQQLKRVSSSPSSVLGKFVSKPSTPQSFRNKIIHKTLESNYNRVLVVKCQSNSPLISPEDTWGIWTALLGTGALGLWLEKTKIGSMVSAALVSILVGLAASNVGIIPYDAPAYSIVMRFLLPLTIPLLLFRADMRDVINSTGTLLLAFLLGSVATVIGTVVAFMLVPMRSLGQDNWKIAAALMGSYIGGGAKLQFISSSNT